MKLFGLSECMEKLTPLRYSTDICGHVTEKAADKTGLKAGTSVDKGAFDIDACALAVGSADEAHLCMIAGTWSINEYIASKPIIDGSVMMSSFYCLPGYYLVEEYSSTSAGNNEWFIKTLLPELKEECKKTGNSIYEQMNAWGEEIPAEEFCPIYLPFLMASNVHPKASGCFVGISNYHTRKHLLRSVYEDVTFSHRYHLEKLLRTRKKPPEPLRLVGGVARSAMLIQMFADVMALPVESVEVNETGSFGCALIGAAVCGDYRNVEEAADRMCQISRPILPEPEKQQFTMKK